MRLLIVDDEELDREGLCEQLNWKEYGIDFVNTARNGFDALRQIEQNPPDIIMTDVKMPGMNGVMLIEKAKNLLPSVKVIFVSGHDDFEFVKGALKVGAGSYILKPIDTQELIDTISEVMRQHLEEEQNNRAMEEVISMAYKSSSILREKILLKLIYGTFDQEEMEELLKEEGIREAVGFSVLLLELEKAEGHVFSDESKEAKKTEEQELTSAARRENGFLQEFNRWVAILKFEGYKTYMLNLDKCKYVILLAAIPGKNAEELRKVLNECEAYMVDWLREKYYSGFTFAEGYSVACLKDVYKSYDQCCDLMLQKVFYSDDFLLRGDAPIDEGINTNKILGRIDKEFVKCIINQDESRMKHLVDYMFENVTADKTRDIRYLKSMCINIISRLEITLYEMNQSFESMFGSEVHLLERLMRFEKAGEISSWLKELLKSLIDYQNKKAVKINRRIVEIVKAFIEENYHHDISLKEISSRVYYSPNHLGLVFKSELGISFSEYLTEYRMKKACELLKNPSVKIYEVSEKVSYKNVAAFSNKFKEQFGITPKEYREGCIK